MFIEGLTPNLINTKYGKFLIEDAKQRILINKSVTIIVSSIFYDL